MLELSRLNQRIKIALVINPASGIGGPAALKGSDSTDSEVLQKLDVVNSYACKRAGRFLSHLFGAFDATRGSDGSSIISVPEPFDLVLAKGLMGADILSYVEVPESIKVDILDIPIEFPSCSEDTKNVVKRLCGLDVDLLVFVGGDGTARDVYDALGNKNDALGNTNALEGVRKHIPVNARSEQWVLGIPAGVKMHSGVFAIDPTAAATITKKLLSRELVSASRAEVRDIDEKLLREGRVNARFYGELLTPSEHHYLQAVKQGGVEIEELVLLDLAEEIRLRLSDFTDQNLLLVFAPGSTTHFIANELGLQTTLLGFDIVQQRGGELQVLATDLNRDELTRHITKHDGPIRLLITPIGGQGHIVGRGNQQLSAELLRVIQRQNLWLLATKAKLESLDHRPLLMDSDDEHLDREWSGFITVITGLNDEVVYRVGYSNS